MKFAKRGKAEAPADEPVAESSAPPPTVSWPEPEPEPAVPEPVVDADAVELTSGPLPASAPVARPVSSTSGAPTHGPAPTPLDSAAAAGAPVADGHGPDPLMDPLKELAAERPEVLVGAAFAGGILAAMILRRLGN